jgi:hypothetical protein
MFMHLEPHPHPLLSLISESCPSPSVQQSPNIYSPLFLQYHDAARDAMEMARLEQEEGNYRVAHDKLFSTVQHLEELNKAVPMELMRMLSLLHRCGNMIVCMRMHLCMHVCMYVCMI